MACSIAAAMVIWGVHHTIGPLVGEVWVSYDHFYIFIDTYIVISCCWRRITLCRFYYYTIALCRTGTTQFATNNIGIT